MPNSDIIARPHLLGELRTALRHTPVVALLGPRQCGKTTMARSIVPADSPNYFDLEDPTSLARLDQPMSALSGLRGTIVIDEVQRKPDLFPILRVLADRKPRKARFLILGSASPDLLRQSSESLAGRIQTIPIAGLKLEEVGTGALQKHWRRGGFPVSYLARTEANSVRWREQFIRTILERDVPQLGIRIPGAALYRFWTMLAHYHGNIWNAAEPARSLGISQPTVRQYLDILTDIFMVRQLQPWHENLLKRQVKAPKVFIRDSGLLHQLLGIHTERDLLTHPALGRSWEGYAIEEVIKLTEPDAAYFWATYSGAELDLLLFKRGRRYGIEVKREDAPTLTKSMRIALDDLKLDHLCVLYPGTVQYELGPRVTVVPLESVGRGDIKTILPSKRAPARRAVKERRNA